MSTFKIVRDPSLVRDVLHRPEDFSPANALVAVTPLTGASLRVLQRARFALPPILASNDSPSHPGIRKVVAGFFTPATVAGIEPRIRELARAAARDAEAALATEGSVDLVPAVAALPPAILMLELLGLDVPAGELAALKAWSRDSLELFWGWPGPERQLELAHSAAEFYGWLRELVRSAVKAPRRSLFAALDEHGLSTPEICSLGYFLLIAGQETTSQLISTVLFRLAEGAGPVAWGDASGGAGRGAPAAREAVRHVLATESSVPTWRRVAVRDTRIGDLAIPAASEILLELTGHHGPNGPGRPTDYALAFGSGVHRCLGAKLAELEAAVVVQETVAALPAVRLADAEPAWLRLLSFEAPLAVRVSRGDAAAR
ncbi:cytochrome P450 [Sinomonas sp. JGH33]|uniref:Cytochrome P450 n=1 Tax=Sinomonas terricola TaxID=3110330 RepID=A0ABU5T816_9MICC|nr:cytochrome P450 [Sinomonas sp. JGH33]MEA5455822.1 cytochrome P450 [Sinomonas sp. JGH33]